MQYRKLIEVFSEIRTPCEKSIIKWINGELNKEDEKSLERDIVSWDKRMELENSSKMEIIPEEVEIKKGMLINVGGVNGTLTVLVADDNFEDGIYGWIAVDELEEIYALVGEDDCLIYSNQKKWIIQTWNTITFSQEDVIKEVGHVEEKEVEEIQKFMEEWLFEKREIIKPEGIKKAYRNIYMEFKRWLRN